MADDKKAGELPEANEALRHPRANLTNDSSLWPFVTAVLAQCAQTISARSAAVFLHDERSKQMRTAVVLEHGRPVDFFGEDRFVELWEPFEVTDSPVWQELLAGKTYRWCDLTDEANLSLKWLVPWYRRLELKGGLAVPLIFNGRPIGLAVFGCTVSDPPPADRLDSLKSLVHEVAVAIQLVRMSGQAKDAEMAQQEMRVAGEVHENVAQYLAAISMHLAAAQSSINSDLAKASKAIDRARELARLGMELARRTTLVLRPSRPAAFGTSHSLVDLIREAGRESTLICDFREVGQIPRAIGAETEKGLLQIAKEAINNALQHAKSQKLIAIVTWYADRVKLEIVDNGIGFDLEMIEEQSEGYGIQGMRECAAELGGTLEIVSCLGDGTRVRATLPMLNV